MKYAFILRETIDFPVRNLCAVMDISRSAYYQWKSKPKAVITAEDLHVYRRAKDLFKASRESLGSRELSKKLCEEGLKISRFRTRNIMYQLGLKVQQRVAYKLTTKRKYSDQVADNLLNQNFNPLASNKVWAGDITYLRTNEGWVYLAVVMDLYSRRIVGWHIAQRMTSDLIVRALTQAVNLRQPAFGLVFHSDRGSQYTGKVYQKALAKFGIRPSMGDVGACWDNAVVERFFGSLKHDWILKIAQPTREHMKQDVTKYIRYYNNDRLHSSNANMSPVQYELSQLNVSVNA